MKTGDGYLSLEHINQDGDYSPSFSLPSSDEEGGPLAVEGENKIKY